MEKVLSALRFTHLIIITLHDLTLTLISNGDSLAYCFTTSTFTLRTCQTSSVHVQILVTYSQTVLLYREIRSNDGE